LKFIESFIPHAKKAAMDLYGCNGVWLPLQSDAWGKSTPESFGWSVWIGAAAWLAQHFWKHYEYNADKTFLKERAYPFFKEVVGFYEDYLQKDENGVYQIFPSQSPENRFLEAGEFPVSICISAAMDVQLAYDALTYAINSATILDVDLELIQRWKDLKDDLPPFKIGADGRLLEWNEEFEEAEPGHRHLSHLYGLYPGELFTKVNHELQYKAAKNSLNFRLAQGGAHTGWSRAWVACMFARLEQPEEFWEHFTGLVKDFATTSLLDLHPPRIFQIDGNLGAVAAVAEALWGSYNGKTYLLSALPKEWAKSGRVKGAKIPGNHTIDFAWENGEVINYKVHKKSKNSVNLVIKGKQEIV
jgi:alpha-L-fucosidase 2